MLSELSLEDPYLELLTENGFDEWISLIEVNDDVLQDIGVGDSTVRKQILACVDAAKTIRDEDCSQSDSNLQENLKSKAGRGNQGINVAHDPMTSNDFKYSQSFAQGNHFKEKESLNFNVKSTSPHLKESIEIGLSEDHHPIKEDQESEDMIFTHKQYRLESEYIESNKTIPLTISKIEKYSFKKINKGESEKHFFGRILHLYIKQAGINHISNLENFPLLRVLDLSDNSLSILEGLDNLSNLEQLTIENNKIEKLQGLEGLQRLKKLYAKKNCIRRLEGLKYCCSLQDIQISNQKVSNGDFFTIEEDSMIGVSESLMNLEMNEVRCKEVSNLQFLRSFVINQATLIICN